jgi:excisionase family DNA binding protein
MTVREAAIVCRCGRDLMYELVREGRIPSLTLGRKILIPRQALLRWIEAQSAAVRRSEP